MKIGLAVDEIVVRRGEATVIDRLSFSVQPGDALLLTGPNGSGKTTLIRALAGLLPVDSGTMRLTCDERLTAPGEADDPLAVHCHYIGHVNAAKAQFTVRETVSFWASVLASDVSDHRQERDKQNTGSDAAIDTALEAVGLFALGDIPVRYLSQGQQRRVAIARLLAVHRPVWLLDEPSVSLDSANVDRLVSFGNAHLDRGGVIVAATHIPLAFRGVRELRLERAVGNAAGDLATDAWGDGLAGERP